MKEVLSVQDLNKIYRQGDSEVHALSHVTLNFHQGEFAALVGPSGSGKTTLLNMIGGLDKPTSGRVFINGIELTALSKSALSKFRLLQLGFIFQAYNLVPVLSALENVELTLVLQGLTRKECFERARHYLDLVGLADLIHRRPSELSGGQQQRVAVARALATRPPVILADEPTANLDSENAGALLDIMSELAQKEHTAFLFSTHDLRVMARAKRIIQMRDGNIESDRPQDPVEKNNLLHAVHDSTHRPRDNRPSRPNENSSPHTVEAKTPHDSTHRPRDNRPSRPNENSSPHTVEPKTPDES